MHIDLTPSDLGRAHSIVQKKGLSNKPRAFIIKFVSYNTRKRIFLKSESFKSNTNYYYRKYNSQENGNLE